MLEDWRIQSNLNNSSGEVRARIKEMANPFKEKIQALRERALALAAEKKKSLIQQMETLNQADLYATEPRLSISSTSSGSRLGRSSLNEELGNSSKLPLIKPMSHARRILRRVSRKWRQTFKPERRYANRLKKASPPLPNHRRILLR